MTHYTDRTDTRGLVRTVCGRLVRAEDRYGELDWQAPSCPKCAAILAERNAEPLPAWAQEGLAKVVR